jgi:tripartite-type tricarboxylate transporter receptor subunit TctC
LLALEGQSSSLFEIRLDDKDYSGLSIRVVLKEPAAAGITQRDGYMPDDRNRAETASFLRKEVAAIGEVVKAAGIEPQ